MLGFTSGAMISFKNYGEIYTNGSMKHVVETKNVSKVMKR